MVTWQGISRLGATEEALAQVQDLQRQLEFRQAELDEARKLNTNQAQEIRRLNESIRQMSSEHYKQIDKLSEQHKADLAQALFEERAKHEKPKRSAPAPVDISTKCPRCGRTKEYGTASASGLARWMCPGCRQAGTDLVRRAVGDVLARAADRVLGYESEDAGG